MRMRTWETIEFQLVTGMNQWGCNWDYNGVDEDNQNAAANQQRINDDSAACL